MEVGSQASDSLYKIFESKNEVVVWSEIFWQSVVESNLVVNLTTNLVFDNGILIQQEDRFAIASGCDA